MNRWMLRRRLLAAGRKKGPHTVTFGTLTNSGMTAYVTINGVMYEGSVNGSTYDPVQVEDGGVIYWKLAGTATIYENGAVVASGASVSYEYPVKSDVRISFVVGSRKSTGYIYTS